jgi:integrase
MRRMSPRRKGRIPGTVYPFRSGYRAQVTLRTGRVSATFESEQAAWEWLAEINDRKRTGMTASSVRMTFGELAEKWLEVGDSKNEYNTQKSYRFLLSRYVNPTWERIKLVDLDPLEIETWLASLMRDGVGGRTRQRVYGVMHAVLEWGVTKRRLGYNPMSGVEKPAYQRIKPIHLTHDQVEAFLDLIRDHPRRIFYTIAIVAGLRFGEMTGLQVQDIDWQRSGINVRHQAVYEVGRGIRIKATLKTDGSAAFVSLGLRSMVLLQEQLEQVEIMRQSGTRAGAWKEHNLVFPTPVGTPIGQSNLRRQYKALLRRAGIDERVRFHDLRHTSLNAAANEIGAPIKATQKRARHAQPSTTMNVYGGDTTDSVDQQLAERLDEWIYRSSG